MLISIQIKNGSTLRADICGENCVCLCYDNSYMPGDVISFQCTEPGYYWVCLEDALAPVLAYFSGTPFEFLIPFGEKRSCYSQKCFIGNRHLLWVRIANPEEITAYRNLAFNPLDHHNNTSLFPHVYANVETRNEAWFSARNVINGNVASSGHGCALPGFVDSKNEEKTERNAGYLVVSHSGGGMLRQGTRKGIRRTPANRGMRAHRIVKGLDISEDVCHGMCP